jgi:hypothetical protein
LLLGIVFSTNLQKDAPAGKPELILAIPQGTKKRARSEIYSKNYIWKNTIKK